jgi:hypothetical protein
MEVFSNLVNTNVPSSFHPEWDRDAAKAVYLAARVRETPPRDRTIGGRNIFVCNQLSYKTRVLSQEKTSSPKHSISDLRSLGILSLISFNYRGRTDLFGTRRES